jgi:hypothetical protein
MVVVTLFIFINYITLYTNIFTDAINVTMSQFLLDALNFTVTGE